MRAAEWVERVAWRSSRPDWAECVEREVSWTSACRVCRVRGLSERGVLSVSSVLGEWAEWDEFVERAECVVQSVLCECA
jgi:hypothetical protein